ncbi:MAG TPA: DUF433 domain-containing protein [Ktedonobacterales bacterium]|jgi:uncharacterized protein (DUF433 family)
MDDPYIEMREGVYRIRGSRVSLDSIVIFWHQGETPEELQEDFPTLTLAQVYGAIAYYLDHKEQIDQYLAENKAQAQAQRAAAEAANPEWYAKMRQRMAEARKRLETETTPQSAP